MQISAIIQKCNKNVLKKDLLNDYQVAEHNPWLVTH